MKKILLIALSALWALGVNAQGVARVTEELARPGFGSGARVEVSVEDDAAAAIRNADHTSGRTTVMVYGVSLLRDNSQNAGENAGAVKAKFTEMYPGVHVSLSYENPWFKVEAGPFVDRTDAVALCGRVLAAFPKAVVIQQEVSLSEIIATERVEPLLPVETTEE